MASIAQEKKAGVVYTKPWTVELILDLARYTADRRLGDFVALEPSAGDGAFLKAMILRLVKSCEKHRMDISATTEAIRAFELDPLSAASARENAYSSLIELGVSAETAETLAQSWIKTGDFLEASLGFPFADFVVGNPPYIRLEEIPSEKAEFYRSSFGTMRGRADIYVAFYEAALNQLKPGGVCAYICADRWLLNDYGKALRKLITTNGFSVRCIVEAHDVEAFESEVSAYPAITVIAHEKQGAVVVAKALAGIESADQARVAASIFSGISTPQIRVGRFTDWFKGEEPWPCASPDSLRCLKLLESTCELLESPRTGTKIGIGVATGADDVFIIKEQNIENGRLLPLALADDLVDGRVNWSGHFLINPWDRDGLVELEAYPKMEKYLRAHHSLLCGRSTAKNDKPERWHKTIDRVNIPLVAKKKLYIADIKERLLPALDDGKTYPHHNLYWITSEAWDLKVLGGLLMSAVGEFFIHSYGVKMRGGYYRFQAQYLRKIRVPKPETISAEIKAKLSRAFDEQNASLATEAALEAYQLDRLP